MQEKIIKSGFILLARKLLESEIWLDKPAWWLKCWIFIILKVNHDKKGNLARGQNHFSNALIYHECRLSLAGIKQESIKNLIEYLKETRQITTRKTARGMIITVCNYDSYQDMTSYMNTTENATKKTKRTPEKHHTNTTFINNKELKEEKNKTSPTLSEEQEARMAYDLSELLFDLILRNNPHGRVSSYSPQQKETKLRQWSQDMLKLIKRDHQDFEKLKKVIIFCQNDDFWKSNILSASKLREKFDTLYLQMKRNNGLITTMSDFRSQNYEEVPHELRA